jgi:hypothetical protein
MKRCPPMFAMLLTLLTGCASGAGSFQNTLPMAPQALWSASLASAGSPRTEPSRVVTSSKVVRVGSGFVTPLAAAVDSSGNVYVADASGVVKVAPPFTPPSNGVMTRISTIGGVTGIAVDGVSNVYLADSKHGLVVKIAASGATTTIGSGWKHPSAIAVAAGYTYVADSALHAVRIISPSGAATFARASFSKPSGISLDKYGDLYVADTASNQVTELAPPFTRPIVRIVSSNSFLAPDGVAVDKLGNIFIADAGNRRLVELSAASGGASPVALVTGLPQLVGVTLDSHGDPYVVEASATSVFEVLQP